MYDCSNIFDPLMLFLDLFLFFFYPIKDIVGSIKYFVNDFRRGMVFISGLYIVYQDHAISVPYLFSDSKNSASFYTLFREILFEAPDFLFSHTHDAPGEHCATIDDEHPREAYK